MISLNEMEEILDEIATEFPQEFYRELNGGIILLPDTKFNNISEKNFLYILGEYHRSSNMGRYISIYYGSFIRLYGHLDRNAFKERLRQTLKHEFTHHMESLAGERELEKKDTRYIENYLRRINRNS